MNPFRDRIVASPWEASGVDVPAIHGSVFERCLAAVEWVRERKQSTGLIIHGETGAGKTHLLRQLRARLTPSAPADTSRRDSLFTWVRLQTSPRMIWRALRRALVEDWFRPVAGVRSQFDRILFHRLAQIRVAEGDLELWYEFMLREDPAGLAELMERIAQDLDLDRNTAIAFEHIAFGRHLRDLRAWLAGDPLPTSALERLSLAQEDAIDEEREDEARRVVLNLCALAGEKLPVVIAFDQVEALQASEEDREALRTFGQVVSELHDRGRNLVLLSSMQSAFLTSLNDAIRESDRARMTSGDSLSLDPVSREQALALIAARLGSVVEVPQDRDPAWPLSGPQFEQLFVNNALTPRRLLAVCAECFDGNSPSDDFISGTTEAAPESISSGAGTTVTRILVMTTQGTAGLADLWEETLAEKYRANTPDRTEEIVRHGFPLAAQLLAPGVREVRDTQLKDVELIFEVPAGRAGMAFAATPAMSSLAARLRRLKAQFSERRLWRMVVLKDPRHAIPKTAKAVRQYIADLKTDGVLFVEPTQECLAALDAFRSLLSDAKSGDLSAGGISVNTAQLSGWLTEHAHAEVRSLVNCVLGREQ